MVRISLSVSRPGFCINSTRIRISCNIVQDRGSHSEVWFLEDMAGKATNRVVTCRPADQTLWTMRCVIHSATTNTSVRIASAI
jgi:hypothetical protein